MTDKNVCDICNIYTYGPRIMTVTAALSTGKQVFFWLEEPEDFSVAAIEQALRKWFSPPRDGEDAVQTIQGDVGMLGMSLHGPFDTEAEAKADSDSH
jgi:hypothetical protein